MSGRLRGSASQGYHCYRTFVYVSRVYSRGLQTFENCAEFSLSHKHNYRLQVERIMKVMRGVLCRSRSPNTH
jgi:hypothetical protein